MSERRKEKRANSSDRRDFPRPPLWLNLLLLTIALATSVFARYQRRELDASFTQVFNKPSAGPAELNQIKAELAEMDLTREALEKELDSRLAYIESLKSREFYLSLDTATKKLYLNFGNDTVRDADVQIGEPATVEGPNEKNWTFVPVKGAFNVVSKEVGLAWRVPPWVYLMKGQPVPADPPTIENGLGKYVIILPNDYIIHSPPSPDSPLQGPKPGSFMVPEADLQAIWDRITPETRVYIF